MDQENFDQVNAAIQELYQARDYAGALDLATRNADRFPEESARIYYWRISLTARLGDLPRALRLLEAALDSGLWYGETLLRRSPSWQPLQGLPEFERLVQRSHALQGAEARQLYPLITLRPQGECTAGSLPCPLLIGLHGNASTAQQSFDFWQPAGTAGWLVAVPQSSQAVWKEAYVWDDLEVARSEVSRHIEALNRQYSIDPDQVVIAGHSMGGEVAIWLALTGAVQARGFIAIAPGGPFMDDLGSWVPFIEQASGRGLSGYFIFGAEDKTILQDNIQTFIDMLTEAGIPCNLEVFPHARHDFVPEFAGALLRGLGFITEDDLDLENE